MLWYAAVVSIAVLWLHQRSSPVVRADLQLLVPLMHVLGIVVVLWRTGRPDSIRRWTHFLLANFVFVAVLVVLRTNSALWCWYHFLAVSLRAAVAIGWSLSALFFPLVVLCVLKNSIRWHRSLPVLLKLSFAGLITTISLEGAAAIIAKPQLDPAGDLSLPDYSNAGRTRPSDSHRVVAAIGGSTMVGFPFAPKYGFGQVMHVQLQQRLQGSPVSFQNLAITGVNFQMACAELAKLPRPPDVLVVYSGHNEFFHNWKELAVSRRTGFGSIDHALGHSPFFRAVNPVLSQYLLTTLVPEAEEFPAGPWCSPEMHAYRLTRYRRQMKQLLTWAETHRIRVVICLPAAAEAGLAPNRSAAASATPAERRRLLAIWRKVRQWQNQGAIDRALDTCRRTLSKYPDIAEFHYRAAECLRISGRVDEARVAFQKACELDQFPIRMLPAYRQAARAEATAAGATVIDVADVLRPLSADGILDERLFPDGVHPSVRCCYVLGTYLADRIVSDQLLKSDTTQPSAFLSYRDCLVRMRFTPDDLVQSLQVTADVLDHYSFFRVLDDGERQQRAEALRKKAEALKTRASEPENGGVERLMELLAE